MSAPKFTKGPWIVCVEDGSDAAFTIFAKSQLRDGKVSAEDWDNCIACAGLNHNETEANAHLIAAAPELYEALEILAAYPLEEFSNENKPDDQPLFGANNWLLTVGQVRAARKALAKARGEA